MPVLPHPTRSGLVVRAASSSSAATASASETNYVAFAHHLHGSQMWHWDGHSGISLIFVVGFLASLGVVFLLLVLLSRLLARTNAPRTPASWVPWRAERPPMDEMPGQRSLLPMLPPSYHSSTPTPSESKSETAVPLLGPGPDRFEASGPPPGVRNPRRSSRYGTPSVGAGSQRTPSMRLKLSSRRTSEGMHRVQSIGRGNSHRAKAGRRYDSTFSMSFPDAPGLA